MLLPVYARIPPLKCLYLDNKDETSQSKETHTERNKESEREREREGGCLR